MSDAEPIITDHALVRWLERRHGIDMDFFRRKILEEVRDRYVVGCKRTKLNGLIYRFSDGRLVTVVRNGPLPAELSENVVPFVCYPRRSAAMNSIKEIKDGSRRI